MLVMHARVFSLRNDDSLKKRCMDLKQKSNIFFTFFFFVPKDIEKVHLVPPYLPTLLYYYKMDKPFSYYMKVVRHHWDRNYYNKE